MSGWFGLGGGKEVEEPSGVEIVKKLSSRIASATLLEDRRDSVLAIKVTEFLEDIILNWLLGFGPEIPRRSNRTGAWVTF